MLLPLAPSILYKDYFRETAVAATSMLHQILEEVHLEIAAQFGRKGDTVPFIVRWGELGVTLRIMAPGADEFDFTADSKDIQTEGATLDDALESAVSSYRKAASEEFRFQHVDPHHKLVRQ